jgi:hypothetical protein
MMLTHPYLDPRVISLAMGTLSHSPRLALKPILAAAMRNILPECILNRSGEDISTRLLLGAVSQLAALGSLGRAAPVDDLGFLGKADLLDCRNGARRECRQPGILRR